MDTSEYVNWINNWLEHVDLRIHFIAQVGEYYLYSFKAWTKPRECPTDDLVYFNDSEIFINPSNETAIKSLMAEEMELDEENSLSVALAVYTIGSILRMN